MANNTIEQITNETGSKPNQGYYCKMSDGTLIQWGNGTIYITAEQPDRTSITYPIAFLESPSVSIQTIENSYNIQPNLLWWSGGDTNKTTLWVLNRSTTPSRHITFCWIAIGRWK